MTWAAIQMLGRYVDADEKPQMTKGRPKGTYAKSTTEIVRIIRERGPSTFREVLPLTGDMSPDAAWYACRRAVKHGLLTLDKSQRPGIYTAVA